MHALVTMKKTSTDVAACKPQALVASPHR